MTEASITAPVEPRRLKGTEKAAALLLAVGKENASRIIAHFGEEEIRVLARSGCDLGAISGSMIEEIAGEFVAQLSAEGGIRASSEQVEELLEETLPPEQVQQIMSEVRSRMNQAVWPRLSEMPAQILAQFLGREHPQVISFVLSKVTISFSAEVLALFPGPLRNEVVRRMLSHRFVTQETLRILEQLLRDELLLKVARTSGQDTHGRIAKIINKLDRRQMDEVLTSLDAAQPKAAGIVRSLLFTFDDVARLPVMARTALLERIEEGLLIQALNGADQALKDLILSSVPSRTRRVIEQELAMAAPLSDKDVEKARREVADTALLLSERGVINLAFEEAEE